MNDEILKLDIRLKELEIKEKSLSIGRMQKRFSSINIGLWTVLISVLGSVVATSITLSNSNRNFSIELIEGIINDDVIVSKRKLEFLDRAGLLNRNRDEIIYALNTLSKKASENYWLEARGAIASDDLEVALVKARFSIELDTLRTESYELLSYIYYKLGSDNNSQDYYYRGVAAADMAIDIDTTRNSAYYWKGRNLLMLNEYDQAEHLFNRLYNSSADNIRVDWSIESGFFLAEAMRKQNKSWVLYCKYYNTALIRGSKNLDRQKLDDHCPYASQMFPD